MTHGPPPGGSEELVQRCKTSGDLASAAATWLAAEPNAATVGCERETLIRSASRARIRAQRLAEAAARPMCVGVFGPSQAGKSYLVEVLARPETGPLRARFGTSDPVDFLAAINPVGEKESTGLVTRFTARPADREAPAGVPVRLRALAELDLVKILGNSFFLDGDQTRETVPSRDDLIALARELEGQAGGRARHLDEAALFDLEDYFRRQFTATRGLDALSSLWDEIRSLAPRLGLADRARLFAPLWGGHETFTRVYLELASALEKLGHPDELFVGLEALVPRERSVLDVATLGGLGRAGDSDYLTVVTAGGASATLARHVVSAVAAELRVELAEPSRPFLSGADLLDFPGARSRQKVALSEFLQQPHAAKETFLRGKVAYLFDRYVAEQELTAMLLCVRPSNQEVVTLPDLVDEWIGLTHGRSPEARSGRPNLLFLVLTWFDSHFVEKAGDAGQAPGLRFRNRIEASLLGFFGKAHRWPREWTPSSPFRNAFWFRNPNYPAESIIRYEGRRELEFLGEKTGRIAELREGFVELPEAQAHFADPGRAFDEALRLNDGGMTYLVEQLSRVCRPELKRGQIEAQLAMLRTELREQLERFHVSTDVGERLASRRALADKAFDALEQVASRDRFGSILRALTIDVSALADALNGAALAPPAAPAAPTTRILRPGMQRDDVQARVQTNREATLARQAIEEWIAHLRRSVESEELQRQFELSTELAQAIVDELIMLANRAGIEARIADDLRTLATVERAAQASAKVALIAATRLNRMVGGLGCTLIPPLANAPTVPESGGDRQAFASRPVTFDASAIGSTRDEFRLRYVTDWFHAYYRTVEDNAMRVDGQTFDVEQNQRLRAILSGLRPLGTAAPA